MANVRKPHRIKRFLIVLIGLTPVVLIYLHLGPKLGFERSPKMLCAHTLSDGSRLFVVQRRNSSLLEAYSSFLYRLYPDGRAEVTELGYEDSYWWLASLRPSADGKSIQVRAWATVAGIYDPDSKVASWPSQKFPSAEARSIPAGDPIRQKLALAKPL